MSGVKVNVNVFHSHLIYMAFQSPFGQNQKTACAQCWVPARMGLEGTEVGNCGAITALVFALD